MGKLHQIIAVVAAKKTHATKAITEVYHKIQKAEPFQGLYRKYRPKDDEGEKLPDESKVVQMRSHDVINEGVAAMSELLNAVAAQDWANTGANADVKVDGKTILTGVPVTHLLFLEKQLVDLGTFISKLPVLDPSEEWVYDPKVGCFATKPAVTTRTKKLPKAFVKYEATKEHPAQVDMFTEDVVVGYWESTKFSGALPAQEKNLMAERVRKLREAVTIAREEANGVEVTNKETAKFIMDYVFQSSSAVSG